MPKIDVSVSKALVQARQTSGSASILVTRSESPIPTAIEVAWIAKPDTPDFPIQTGIIELKDAEPSKAINLALPSSPSSLDAIGIDFELVKADPTRPGQTRKYPRKSNPSRPQLPKITPLLGGE